jgi:predicted metal-binding membrane protein
VKSLRRGEIGYTMRTSALVIISVVIIISVLTWLVSIWQYDVMMSSMMTFYNPSALSLFVIIWTAGMAAMMFPAIVPMILVYNRLIDTSRTKNNTGIGSSQLSYHESDDGSNDNDIEETGHEGSALKRLRSKLRSKSYDIILFGSAYLAIWALTGIILLVGWSLLFGTIFSHLGESNVQGLVLTNTIYGIVLIISGVYQFSSLKTRCLGYCESPLSFFMRRWRKGKIGALKMGMYHGLYCLGCCWPYFLLMVALGWMNVIWMGLFAAIIFTEKVWSKGGLWVARMTGIGFIALGIMSSTGVISLPSDSMNNGSSGDSRMMMSMDMSSSSSQKSMGMSSDMSTDDVDNSRKN